MAKKLVVMPLMPSHHGRYSGMRADLSYAVYGRATWEWWCRRNGAEFIALDYPLGSDAYEGMAPTIRRWLAPGMLVDRYGPDTRIALVDADTMIRWDTPDLFDLAGERLGAVIDSGPRWIHQDVRAYQHFFPDVVLPWWEYVNAGVVVLGDRQLATVGAFLDFVKAHWQEMRAIQACGARSVDQTLFNFMLKRRREAVTFLPSPFNLVRCVPMNTMLWAWESGATSDETPVRKTLRSATETFDFIEYGYVWHFTNVVRSRRLVMEETWRRTREHYPGADILPSDSPLRSQAAPVSL